MAIYMPERVLFAAFIAAYTRIKADLSSYIEDIFDADVVGTDFINRAKSFLSAQKISLSYGYPADDEKTPSWHLVLMGSSDVGGSVENLLETEIDETNGKFLEAHGVQKQFTLKLISSSESFDAVIFMDSITRYILIQIKEDLSSLGMEEVTYSISEVDPIFQYLPDKMFHRAVTIGGKCFDAWTKTESLLQDIEVAMTVGADVYSITL